MSKNYRLEEVQEHNTKEDLWLVIHNRVYDASHYLDDHPGGAGILLEVAGVDATTEFEEAGHSLEATNALRELYVGDLHAEQKKSAVQVYRPKFEIVSQTTDVIRVDKTRKNQPLPKILTVGGILGVLGVAACRRELYLNLLPLLAYEIPLSLPIAGSRARLSSPGNFWLGFGIAAAGGVVASISSLALLWSKIGAHADFHHAPYIEAQPDRVVRPSAKKVRGRHSTAMTTVLERKSWKPFKLVRKLQVSPKVYRMLFALPRPGDSLGLPTGQHIALQARIKGKSVSRSYTPVSNNSDLGRIELLVKVYDGGLMTEHLEGLQIGDTIDIRGPKGTMEYSPSYARHIGMIAGGTGITPMYQLIRAICEDASEKTRISLIYANNSENDILLRDELEGFAKQCPDKFSVHYVLTKPPADWEGSKGFVTASLIAKHLPGPAPDTKMLLCGPPMMVNAMKANLVGMGFNTPSVISKVTDQIFLF